MNWNSPIAAISVANGAPGSSSRPAEQGDRSVTNKKYDPGDAATLRRRALARWDNEGGAADASPHEALRGGSHTKTPASTPVESTPRRGPKKES